MYLLYQLGLNRMPGTGSHIREYTTSKNPAFRVEDSAGSESMSIALVVAATGGLQDL
jgi:hypothetical protein